MPTCLSFFCALALSSSCLKRFSSSSFWIILFPLSMLLQLFAVAAKTSLHPTSVRGGRGGAANAKDAQMRACLAGKGCVLGVGRQGAGGD